MRWCHRCRLPGRDAARLALLCAVVALTTSPRITAADLPVLSGTRDLGSPGHSIQAFEQRYQSGDRTIRVWYVLFSSSDVSVRVLDTAGDGRQRIADLARSSGALAAINASYFDKDLTPLGLVISDGHEIQPTRQARLLSGIVDVRGGQLELIRTNRLSSTRSLTQAIQAGPWLLENGAPMPGLEDTRSARRSIIATDRHGRWALISTSPATLAEAARLLAHGNPPAKLRLRDALNLDGGSSSALYIATNPPLSIPELGYVTNGLFLFPGHR